MPYKDPAKQRAYLRNWRRMQKLYTAAPQTTVSRLSQQPLSSQLSTQAPLFVQHTSTSNLAVRWKRIIPSAPLNMPPALDQRALKTSPDGALQTGREATRAYQISRSQFTAPRISYRSILARRPAVPLTARRSQHVAMPVAALLVELLSRMFA
jgi:hypothetical protein